ncbi:MAG: hypothetical protein ACFFG0_41695 [Candidatus Thorarchaeota archaeon]
MLISDILEEGRKKVESQQGKYQKPKCDCGEELILKEEVIYLESRKINANGEASKRSSKDFFYGGHNGVSWLECPKCRNEYNIDMHLGGKHEGKYFRGEKRY